MRKWIPVIIVTLIAVIGGVLAVTYEAPEFIIFLFNQKVDQELFNPNSKVGNMKEEILNELQPVIIELIYEGQTYDQSSNLTEVFATFNEINEKLTIYVQDTIPEINEFIEELNFDPIEQKVNSLVEEHQLLAKALIQSQQERLELLLTLNTQLEQLEEILSDFNVMFYHTERPSQSIVYFQSIVYLLEEIETIHNDYVRVTDAYQQAKTDYYLILINMGLKEYFFGH